MGLYSNSSGPTYAFWMNWNIVYSGTGNPQPSDYCPKAGGGTYSALFKNMPNSDTKWALICTGSGIPWTQTLNATFTSAVSSTARWNPIYYDLYGGNGVDPVAVTWTLTAGSSGKLCPVNVARVLACNASAYAGVTVNIYTSQGGSLVASCVTDGNGFIAYPSCLPSFGTYWVTIGGASSRFAPFAQSVTFTCFQPAILQLTAASNYVCIPNGTCGPGMRIRRLPATAGQNASTDRFRPRSIHAQLSDRLEPPGMAGERHI